MRSELGSIRQRKRGVWECRVSLGYVNGKRKTKSKTVRGTRKDARIALNQMLVESGRCPGECIPLSEFVRNVYLPWHRKTYPRKDTTAKLEYTLSKVCEELGSYELGAITRPLLVSYFQSQPQWKLDKLRAVLNKAVEWEYIDRNPCPKNNKQKQPDRKRLTVEQLALVLDAVHGSSIEAGVILQAFCGLRVAEALALDWADIDFERGKVSIFKTWHYESGHGWMEETKTPTSTGQVAIPGQALERLRHIRCDGGIIRTGAVMPAATSEGRMIPNTYTTIWRRLVQPILGADYIPAKNLRHTHGSILFDEGVPLDFIAKRLRHASSRVTERHYVREDSTADDVSAEVFDKAMA